MNNPRVRHRNPTPQTRWQLYGLTANTCAWPGCSNDIFALEHNKILLGEACHINGQTDLSARFDPDQTEEENRSIHNLIGMCPIHHKIIDHKDNEAQYPAELLLDWREQQYRRVKDRADRSWIKPANFRTGQFVRPDGQIIQATAHFWIDKDGKPQIYTDRQFAVTNLLREFYLDIDRLSTLQKCVNDNPEGRGKDFLQFGMKHHYKGSPIAHLLRVMAVVPEVSLAEILNYLVVGNDATKLIENMGEEFSKVVDGSMTLKDFLDINDEP